jgi:hypothetical protein
LGESFIEIELRSFGVEKKKEFLMKYLDAGEKVGLKGIVN